MEYKKLKRIIDIFGALFGIVLFSPLMLVTALFIKIESSGPALVKLPRCGKNFKTFQQFKLRSMVINADKMVYENPELRKSLIDNGYKLRNDPRVTKVGKIIRRFSIDELPQFFNVLKGEMSLVGPRPTETWTWDNYIDRNPEDKEDVKRIMAETPGLTGLWQVSGRSELFYEKRVKLDIEYIDSMSIITDIKILIKTIFVIINPKGAW
jgi:lipopolysaccharide/colanic/teichoic acid biosynthesis glycosyltransferase